MMGEAGLRKQGDIELGQPIAVNYLVLAIPDNISTNLSKLVESEEKHKLLGIVRKDRKCWIKG